MEEAIEASVPPEAVWQAWEKAHALHGKKEIVSGANGKNGFKYRILDVEPGIRFSMLWKSLFVHLIFTHMVTPAPRGSEIRYSVKIQGFFAWPVRFFLGKKIRRNLSFVLKEFAKRLESDVKAYK